MRAGYRAGFLRWCSDWWFVLTADFRRIEPVEVAMVGEYWAAIDPHGVLIPGTIWPDFDDTARAVAMAIGASWHALHGAGYRLRRVRVEILTAETAPITPDLRPTPG